MEEFIIELLNNKSDLGLGSIWLLPLIPPILVFFGIQDRSQGPFNASEIADRKKWFADGKQHVYKWRRMSLPVENILTWPVIVYGIWRISESGGLRDPYPTMYQQYIMICAIMTVAPIIGYIVFKKQHPGQPVPQDKELPPK